MKNLPFLLVIGVLMMSCPYQAGAVPIIQTVSASSGNSSVLLNVDDAAVFRRPFSLDWTIDGDELLVYSSQPTDQIGGFHHLHAGGPGLHITSNQIHVSGSLVGPPLDDAGGVIYTVTGGALDSGISRLSEKVDITVPISSTIHLTGLGAHPSTLGATFATRHGFSGVSALAVPDLSNFEVSGTTVVFYSIGALVGAPFGPLTILPVVSFEGFNPFDQDISLTGCAADRPCILSMITELNVSRIPPDAVLPEPSTWLLLALGLALLVCTQYRRRYALVRR